MEGASNRYATYYKALSEYDAYFYEFALAYKYWGEAPPPLSTDEWFVKVKRFGFIVSEQHLFTMVPDPIPGGQQPKRAAADLSFDQLIKRLSRKELFAFLVAVDKLAGVYGYLLLDLLFPHTGATPCPSCSKYKDDPMLVEIHNRFREGQKFVYWADFLSPPDIEPETPPPPSCTQITLFTK